MEWFSSLQSWHRPPSSCSCPLYSESCESDLLLFPLSLTFLSLYCSLWCVSNILDIFQRCPKLFILYPHKTNADWNQLLHLWPVFRCQKYRGVNSKIFSQKRSFSPQIEEFTESWEHTRVEFDWVNVPNSAILVVGAWCTFKFMSLT